VDLNKVDLNKLRGFLAVAELGGISRAARSLALTPSAVSQSLSALEGSLGVRLFDRVGRALVATREGRALATRFRRVHEELRAALADVANEPRHVRGVVRLGVFLGAPRVPIARVASAFAARHREAQVRIQYGSRAELRRLLLGNRLDFALALRAAREPAPRIRASVLFRQELVLAQRERPPRGRATPEWLATLPIVDYYPSAPLIERWLAHHFPRRKLAADVRVWAASADLALELVLAGAGAAVLPDALVEPFAREGRLHVVRGARAELGDSVWLEELAGAWRGPALAAFRETLVAELGAKP
jgi:DNA-binding transcriptional LysR family regulator